MTVPLFNINSTVRQLYQDGVDTLLAAPPVGLGRPCRIVLDGARTPCPNCKFDAQAGRSADLYNGSGPIRFTRPPCPVCGGTGYDPATLTRTEERVFLIKRNVKPSAVLPPGTLTRPRSIARIKGFATDMPLVIQMKYIVLDYANAVYSDERYVRLDEPTNQGSIVPGRYFTAHLQRFEG